MRHAASNAQWVGQKNRTELVSGTARFFIKSEAASADVGIEPPAFPDRRPFQLRRLRSQGSEKNVQADFLDALSSHFQDKQAVGLDDDLVSRLRNPTQFLLD